MMPRHTNYDQQHHTSSNNRSVIADSSSFSLNESQPQFHQTPLNGYESSNIGVIGGACTTMTNISSDIACGSIGGLIGCNNLNNLHNVNHSYNTANNNFSTITNVDTSTANNGNQSSQSNNFYISSNGYDGGGGSSNNYKNKYNTTNENVVKNLSDLNSNTSNGNLNNLPNLSNHNINNLANSFSRQRRGSGGMVQRAVSRSDLLSKSVGTPSFLNRTGSRGDFRDRCVFKHYLPNFVYFS